MACHSRGGIIQNDDCAGGLVVDHVHERVDACVHEGGITDYSHPALNILSSLCLLHTVESADAGSHTDRGVNDA